MKIYEFDSADNQAYLHATDDVIDQCRPEPPRPIGMEWSPPTCEIVGRDEFRSFLPKTDFPKLIIATAVLSARAVERLRPALDSCGEILPIYLSNDRDVVYLFNVTRIINSVDMKRSQFQRFPSGRIAKCEHLVFDPDMIPDDALFFKNTQMGPVTEIYATEAAVTLVKNARLTGYEFRPVWTND
ncbi:MAG: DUF1629 domain-containing protein [Pirellulales bacterium]